MSARRAGTTSAAEAHGRADLIGFNYTWWLIWIPFIFFIFLPWDAAVATEPHERIVH
jgi:hypothetical protein